jgi:DNA-binding CsgD family transcriptional regulator
MGREDEAGQLAAWVAELAAGRGRAALVEGEPGIGKSALLRAAGAAATGAGCAVFLASGEEPGQEFPLRPLLGAFAVEDSAADPRRADVLAALAAQRHTSAPGGPDAALAAAAERLLALIDQLCAENPTLLVVDDLHWADAATVSVCYRLCRSAAQRPLLLIGATRPLPPRTDLDALRRAIGRAGHLRLGPLPAAAVTRLVTALTGGAPGPRLSKLAQDAAGNPSYVTELVGALRRSAGLAVADGVAEVTSGPGRLALAEAIADQLGFLALDTRQTLQAAALLGSDFTVRDLTVVTRRPTSELMSALSQAQAAGVLAEAGGRLEFRHALIRAALCDAMPAPARAAWHRDAAHALLQSGAPVDRVARQLLAGVEEAAPDQASARGADWAADWLAKAAPTLVSEASEVAVRLLEPLMRQLPVADGRRHILASHLARALGHQAKHDEAEKLIAGTLPHVANPDVLVALYDTLDMSRDITRTTKGDRTEQTLADIERSLATTAWLTPTARRHLRVLQARARGLRGGPARAEPAARRALAEATAAGDCWATAWTTSIVALAMADRGDLDGAIRQLDIGLGASERAPGLTDVRLMLLLNRGEMSMALDRLEEAQATFAAARALAERAGLPHRLAQARTALCQLLFEAGQWDDALAEADLLESGDNTPAHAAGKGIAAVIALHRRDRAAPRRVASARQLAAQDVTGGGRASPATLALALDREVAGHPSAALAILVAAAEAGATARRTPGWLSDIVRLATLAGDPATATAATVQAQALAKASHTPSRAAAAAHCRGLLAADPTQLLTAADRYGQAGRPLRRAQALEAAASLLAAHGDTAGARAPFAAAIDIYTALGATWDLTRVRAGLRQHGIRNRRASTRATSGWAALTATEAKVAALVAQGQSNPEIAQTLGNSRRTVEYHVTRILAKLQMRSRAEIIQAAATSPSSNLAQADRRTRPQN